MGAVLSVSEHNAQILQVSFYTATMPSLKVLADLCENLVRAWLQFCKRSILNTVNSSLHTTIPICGRTLTMEHESRQTSAVLLFLPTSHIWASKQPRPT